ncbi:DUF3017 domain-containing protein [Cellulosimicrobium terreum]|nr:DUF3017 domain-containing protein [Cellulosimicrobium terreum]
MSDVTAARSVAPDDGIVPRWHHTRDGDTREGDTSEVTSDVPGVGRPVPDPPVSLAPGRQPAMWLVLAGVGVTTVVAVLAGALVGCLVLAGVLVVAGVARACLPAPGPVGITVRSRGLDVFFFLAPAAAIVFLVVSLLLTLPNG